MEGFYGSEEVYEEDLENGWTQEELEGIQEMNDTSEIGMYANLANLVATTEITGTTVKPHEDPSGRKYLPTLSDLVDRLTIVQLKAIFISEHREEYQKERRLIEHDIDLILKQLDRKLTASDIHAIIMIMLTNRFIWESESRARAGGSEQDKLLKLTHSINGVRNTAKNMLAQADGGRKDFKIDCFASELVESFGNWNVFS